MLATIEEAINITDRINQDKKKAEYYLLNYEKEYLFSCSVILNRLSKWVI